LQSACTVSFKNYNKRKTILLIAPAYFSVFTNITGLINLLYNTGGTLELKLWIDQTMK